MYTKIHPSHFLLFNNFCMYIMAEFFNLCVLACCTLNISFLLKSIPCIFSFKGNIFFVFSFFEHLWANFRQRYSLLCSNGSKSRISNAFLKLWYLELRIIFNTGVSTNKMHTFVGATSTYELLWLRKYVHTYVPSYPSVAYFVCFSTPPLLIE